MTTGPGNAVARRDNTAIDLVPTYRVEFTETLPAHITPETFIRLAQGALRRNPELLKAANNDPASFIFALREAARLGHEPGTDNFWLIPLKGRVEGWEGYKGVVERMYRAGAVVSVKAEVVRANDDFDFDAATMSRPKHTVDWRNDDRGEIFLAYAYAEMQGGGTSKVVTVGKSYIAKIKAESRGSDRADSPWVKWPEAMWLKTALLRLEPWVPTSSEYLREKLRFAAEAAAAAGLSAGPTPQTAPAPARAEIVDHTTGEVTEAIEGEFVQ